MNEILFYNIVFSVLMFFLGAIMGSFLECLSDRTSHGISITKGRSKCPVCGHTLSPLELVPIFSWIFLGGKCRHCKAKIPVRHLFIELFTACAYLASFLIFGISFELLFAVILISVLIPASLSDLHTMEVSDAYFITGSVAFAVIFAVQSIAKGFAWQDLVSSLIGGIGIPLGIFLVSLLLERILKKGVFGGADLKLLFMTGLYLGWMRQLLAVILMCVFGLIGFVVKRIADKKKGEAAEQALLDEDGNVITVGAMPFVPAIALAAIVSYLVGNPIVNAYISLF